jgi:galactose oxidase
VLGCLIVNTTVTLLGDGSVLTLGGSWIPSIPVTPGFFIAGLGFLDNFFVVDPRIGNKNGEVWDVTTGLWTNRAGIRDSKSLRTADKRGFYRSDNHYWLFTAPNGNVFHAGPAKRTHWIDTAGDGSVVESVYRSGDDAMNGNAVSYDIGKILTLGGSANYDTGSYASDRVYHIDINGAPTVTRLADMHFARTMSTSVVLPSGEVVVVGGLPKARIFSDSDAILTPEIWSPVTGQWRVLSGMSIPRTYHSFALLLKDGRVLAGGGGVCGQCKENHADIEIITPPYLLDSSGQLKTRPVIQSFPSTVDRTQSFTVQMDTNDSHSFALVRLAAVTHSVNNDMRRIPLSSTNMGGGSYMVNVSSNANVSLPGLYFLFAMNSEGVPSEAETVDIS